MSVRNIGDIKRRLEACLKARSAIDSAVRVYDDTVILVDQAANAVSETYQVMVDAADAAQAAYDAKVQAIAALEAGVHGLLNTIRDAKNIKRGNALDTCLAAREVINSTAQEVNRLKQHAENAAELSSIADAALDTAQSAWTERQRIYDNAVTNVTTARNAILEVATIVGGI